MTQATDTDIRELKDLLLGLDKKIDVIDTRLIEVEKKIDKQDSRLWAFGGIILTASLGITIKLLAFPNP
jgi:hypothetical protein